MTMDGERVPLLPAVSRQRSGVSDSDVESGPRVRRASSASGGHAIAVSRWQQSAARILHGRSVVDAIDEAVERHEPGAAPGIDPRRNKYAHLAAKWCLPVDITLVDYDARDLEVQGGIRSAEDLRAALQQPRQRAPSGAWRVRWIHVDGLNWDAVQELALHYDLHPLALEDTVHVPQRIKADFYDRSLYVSLIYLYLAAGSCGSVINSPQQTPHHSHRPSRDLGAANGGAGPRKTAGSATVAPPAAARSHAGSASTAGGGAGGRGGGGGHKSYSIDEPTLIMARTLSSLDRDPAAAAVAAEVSAALAAMRSRSTPAPPLPPAASVDGAPDWEPEVEEQDTTPHPVFSDRRLARVSSPGPSHYPLSLHRGHVTLSHNGAPPEAPAAAAASGGGVSNGGGAMRRSLTRTGSAVASVLGLGRKRSGHGELGEDAPGLGASGGGRRGSEVGGQGPGEPGAGGQGRCAQHQPHSCGTGSGRAIHVSAQQVSLFLLRGEHANTLITIFQSDGSAVTRPILAQLREQRTLVREAEDASFLANLVIDTLVDHIFPVVGAYTEQLQQYEAAVLAGGLPSAASTRELHAMQRDLRRIDRTIAPLQNVVGNMISRDTAAGGGGTLAGSCSLSAPSLTAQGLHPAMSAASASGAAGPGPGPHPVPSFTPSVAGTLGGSGATPFLTRLTCTYLGDVKDHVATICEDLISLSMECGDLVQLIFNLTTHQQSQSTQTLAVVSTIFLPITFLAGVYGMNFDMLPELHWDHGYLYFWITSLTIVVVFMIVMWRAGLV